MSKKAEYSLKLTEDTTTAVLQPNGEQWWYKDGLLMRIFGVKDEYVCEVRHFEVEREKRKKVA
jgi:hypothetical protein